MWNSRTRMTVARLVLTTFIAVSAGVAVDTASAQPPSPAQRMPSPKVPRKTTKPPENDRTTPDKTEPAKTDPAQKDPTQKDPGKDANKPTATTTAAGASRSWLDAPVKNWNLPGAAIPKPVLDQYQPGMENRCKASLRTGNSPEDTLVTGAGWFLFGPRQTLNDVTIVSGTAGADGMCRPMGYQSFVFVGGAFAGTIAPAPMASRMDGDADRINLFNDAAVTVEFRRYKDADPLCCPSGRHAVTYRIERKGSPLLVPADITPVTQ